MNTAIDVDSIITENGFADLRGLSPHEKAICIIDNLVNDKYKDRLSEYYQRTQKIGFAYNPICFEETFQWHINYLKNKEM